MEIWKYGTAFSLARHTDPSATHLLICMHVE